MHAHPEKFSFFLRLFCKTLSVFFQIQLIFITLEVKFLNATQKTECSFFAFDILLFILNSSEFRLSALNAGYSGVRVLWVIWLTIVFFNKAEKNYASMPRYARICPNFLRVHVQTFLRSCPDFRALTFRFLWVFRCFQTISFWAHEAVLVRSRSVWTCLIPSETST